MNYTGYFVLYLLSLGISFSILYMSIMCSNIKRKELKYILIISFFFITIKLNGIYIGKNIEQKYYNNTEYSKIETKDTDYLYPRDDWYMVVDEQTGETYLRSDCLDFMNEGD